MNAHRGHHPSPPFDAALSAQAFHETWLATVDPTGVGQWFRRQRLDRLIATATRDSPLYARRARSARVIDDFEPIGKHELMDHFDDWAVDRRITRAGVEAFIGGGDTIADGWLERYLIWTSSGTSGQPGVFVQDAASLAAYDAIEALRLRSTGPAGPPLGLWAAGRRFAYVGAVGGAYAGHVSVARLQRIAPPGWAPTLCEISVLDPLDEIEARLRAWGPDVLITYPTLAASLAGRTVNDRRPLRFGEVWLGGEQLSPTQRAFIGDAFGCVVRNSYGASEFYSIAFECRYGRLHLNDDWVILEPVDADHRPVPVGAFSHATLLTNLANRTQPLIRYTLQDCTRFVPEPCPCGSGLAVIEVQGRSDDALVLAGRDGGTVTLLPLAIETVVEEAGGITEFQLIRRPDGSLELRLSLQGDAARQAFDRCRRALLGWFARQDVRTPRLVHGHGGPLRAPGSGKLRRVIDDRAR